jgi:hypothetical protein
VEQELFEKRIIDLSERVFPRRITFERIPFEGKDSDWASDSQEVTHNLRGLSIGTVQLSREPAPHRMERNWFLRRSAKIPSTASLNL